MPVFANGGVAGDITYGPLSATDNQGNVYYVVPPASQLVTLAGPNYFFAAAYLLLCLNPNPGPTTVILSMTNYGTITYAPNGEAFIVSGVLPPPAGVCSGSLFAF